MKTCKKGTTLLSADAGSAVTNVEKDWSRAPKNKKEDRNLGKETMIDVQENQLTTRPCEDSKQVSCSCNKLYKSFIVLTQHISLKLLMPLVHNRLHVGIARAA